MSKSASTILVALLVVLALGFELTESRSALTLKKFSPHNKSVKARRIDDCGSGYECKDCSVS